MTATNCNTGIVSRLSLTTSTRQRASFGARSRVKSCQAVAGSSTTSAAGMAVAGRKCRAVGPFFSCHVLPLAVLTCSCVTAPVPPHRPVDVRQNPHHGFEKRTKQRQGQQRLRLAHGFADLLLVMPLLGIVADNVKPILRLAFAGPAHGKGSRGPRGVARNCVYSAPEVASSSVSTAGLRRRAAVIHSAFN